jgi:hypothetical protein
MSHEGTDDAAGRMDGRRTGRARYKWMKLRVVDAMVRVIWGPLMCTQAADHAPLPCQLATP